MRDLDIGRDADSGRPDDDGSQSYEEAESEAIDQFWNRCGDAREFFGDDIAAEPGPDSETIDIYRKHDHHLLSQECVYPYAVEREQESER